VKSLDISASNQFKGTVAEIKEGSFHGRVMVNVGDGKIVSATITMDAIQRLGLKEDSVVYAIVNPADVMIFAEFPQ